MALPARGRARRHRAELLRAVIIKMIVQHYRFLWSGEQEAMLTVLPDLIAYDEYPGTELITDAIATAVGDRQIAQGRAISQQDEALPGLHGTKGQVRGPFPIDDAHALPCPSQRHARWYIQGKLLSRSRWRIAPLAHQDSVAAGGLLQCGTDRGTGSRGLCGRDIQQMGHEMCHSVSLSPV